MKGPAGFRGGAGKREASGRAAAGNDQASQQYALDVTPCCVVSTRELSMRIVAEECIAVGSSVETALPPAMVRPHKTLSLSSTDFHVTRIIEFIVLLHQTPSPPPRSPFSVVVTHCATKYSVI